MFKKLVVILFVFSLILSVAVVANATVPTDVRLTWTGDPSTTQTINWTSNQTGTTGKVQYKKSSDSTYTTVTAPAPTAMSGVELWTVTLTGLSANTTYNYRVAINNNWSAYSTFKTAPSSASTTFKFLVFGDTSNEDLDYAGFQANINAAFAAHPDAKFFMENGDIANQGQLYNNWAPWIAAAQNVVNKIPAMLTVGKDECLFGEDPETEEDVLAPPALFKKVWPYPQNGPANFKGDCYSFDYASAHIAVIPNQVSGYFPTDPAAQIAMLESIAAWLDADLAATTKTWKIVSMHLDFYPTMSDRGQVLIRQYIQPILDEYHVDIVFDGHVHTMARTFPINNNRIYSNPADGTVYVTVGMGQADPKEDVNPKYFHSWAMDGQTNANYLAVEVEDHEIKITTTLANGTVVDVFEINKTDPSDSTIAVANGQYIVTRSVILGSISRELNAPEQDATGEWFVDINEIAYLINGHFFPDQNLLVYDDDELFLPIPGNPFLDETKTKISLAGLRSIGFEAYYDEVTNLVMIDRYRD